MRTLAALAVLLATAGLRAEAGEIADLHRQLPPGTPDSVRPKTVDRITPSNHNVTAIGIERSACFGTCPIYTFIVKSDGTFRYQGDDYVERKGEFSGKVPVWYFNSLARFIKDAGYMGLRSDYSMEVTDHPTVYTMVETIGERKVISNYANAGPPTLWAIEQLIDGLLAKAEWTDKKPGT